MEKRTSGFVEALVDLGLTDVCASPGSRSGPLTVAFARHPAVQVHMHADERSSAFFALGLARASGRPVALVCTSGSAGAHFHPALVEATEAHIPLIVLTADRPPRLKDCGEPQTTQQLGMFGPHVKYTRALTLEGEAGLSETLKAGWRTAVSAPAGPIHFNIPLDFGVFDLDRKKFMGAPAPGYAGRDLGGRGVIVAGPTNTPDPLLIEVARRTGAPVLADPLSQLRTPVPGGVRVIGTYDAFLRDPDLAQALAPDWIMGAGGTPTSKALRYWMEAHEHVRCGLSADVAWLPRVDARWAETLERLEAAASVVIERHDSPVASIIRAVEDGGVLFAASSMPVRDVDSFLLPTSKRIRVFANRGVNGIDGAISTALGVATMTGAPTKAIVGDLATWHDLGALARLPQVPNLEVFIVNNDGGGIFEYLPVAEMTDIHEPYFVTPHGLTFKAVADALGAGGQVVEIIEDREQSVAAHRALWSEVCSTIGGNSNDDRCVEAAGTG